MSKETKPNMSVEYGNGIGKVEFNPRKFSLENLREIVRKQMSSSDSPIISLTYCDGQIKTIGKEDLANAGLLSHRARKKFIIRVAGQMDRVAHVSIAREVEEMPYHPKTSADPILNFVETLNDLDSI